MQERIPVSCLGAFWRPLALHYVNWIVGQQLHPLRFCWTSSGPVPWQRRVPPCPVLHEPRLPHLQISGNHPQRLRMMTIQRV